MKRRLALVVLALALPARAGADEIAFHHGARETVIKLDGLPRLSIDVRDPTDRKKRKRFEGVRLADVLSRLLAPAGADALAVRCDDGWLSVLPLALLQRFPGAVLATRERIGAEPPTRIDEPRGPVFLVWPNAANPQLDGEPLIADGGWTWGVASLEYVREADFVTPLAPPPTAGADAKRGLDVFRRACQHCHAIRGAGGRSGWDLAEPNVLTYRSTAYLRAYVLTPQKQNPYGHMPSQASKLEAGELDALVAYLRALGP